MIDLLCLLVLLAVAGSLGLIVLRAVGGCPTRPDERLPPALGLGLGLLGVAGLGLAAAHELRPLPVLAVCLAALLAGTRDLVQAARAIRWPRGWEGVLLLVVAAVVVGTALPPTLAPAVGGDQTKYQLAYPRLYAEAGGLVPTPWTFWGQQQFLRNFAYAVAFALRGDVLARLLNLADGVLAAWAVGTLVARHLAPRLGVLAGTLVLALPMTWTTATRAGSDCALVLATVLAVTALLDWLRDGAAGSLRRTALLAGVAAGTKVLGLLVPALVGLVVLGELARRRTPPGRALGQAVAFGVLVVVVGMGPYARNAIETGNPLHPFGQSVFPGRHWSVAGVAYLNDYYHAYQATYAARRGAAPYAGATVARFPWDLTMYPASFENAPRFAFDVGPFVLAFAPAVLLLAGRRPTVLLVAAIGAAFVAIIAAGAWAHPRYVLPGWLLLLAAAVPAAEMLLGSRRAAAAVLVVTIAGSLLIDTKLLGGLWQQQLQVALGRRTPEAFLAETSPRWVFWQRANAAIPDGQGVVVLEKIPHPYYIARPFALLSYLEQELVDYRVVRTPDALDAATRALGAHFVAVDVEGLGAADDPHEAAVTALWREFLATHTHPVLEAGGYALYALSDDGAGRPS